MNEKEKSVNQQLQRLVKTDSVVNVFNQIQHQKDIEGISYYGFDKNKLVFWSNSTVSFNNLSDFNDTNGVVLVKDGLYQYVKKQLNQHTFLGLILIKSEYTIQNNYLKTGLHPSYGIKDDVEILRCF